MRVLSVVAALFLFEQTPSGVFETELWPGEGRPKIQAVVDELAIHETPSSSAKIVRRLRVGRGRDMAFDRTRYRTTQPGHLEVVEATHITGRVLGPIRSLSRDEYYMGRFPRQAVPTKRGDVIDYLQYRAEGTCFVRVGEQVVDADPCPAQDGGMFHLATRPKTEWWIRVVWDRLPVGWVMVDGKAVKENGRTF
jgi:phage tail protein X